MRSFWADPYLWVHLTGIAAVPIFLELCLLGLAVGEPLLPAWLELSLIGIVGTTPILWMQWNRPFSIFSLVVLALKPEQLTADQRRILQLFRTPIDRILAILTAIALLGALGWLYQVAPIASGAVSFLPIGRGIGLLGAAIAFLLSNLFLQVPVSVLRVLLTSESQFAATEPYPVEQIPQSFTLLGLQVKHILPSLVTTPQQVPSGKALSGKMSPENASKEASKEVSKTPESVVPSPSSLSTTSPPTQKQSEELQETVDVVEAEEAIATAQPETSDREEAATDTIAPEMPLAEIEPPEIEAEGWEDAEITVIELETSEAADAEIETETEEIGKSKEESP